MSLSNSVPSIISGVVTGSEVVVVSSLSSTTDMDVKSTIHPFGIPHNANTAVKPVTPVIVSVIVFSPSTAGQILSSLPAIPSGLYNIFPAFVDVYFMVHIYVFAGSSPDTG